LVGFWEFFVFKEAILEANIANEMQASNITFECDSSFVQFFSNIRLCFGLSHIDGINV